MTISVSPFAAGCGADISGVDIRKPLSTADRDAIRAAWLANLVLRFRDQKMTDAEHMAFTRQFGDLELNPAKLIEKQYGVETQTSWAHTVQAKYTWRQEWRVGDLVWWDNRCAMHRRDAFDPETRRLMHRTQLKGTRPV